MEDLFKIVGIVVAFLALTFALSLLFAWPVMVLWNWVCVSVLGLKVITFWQSWGLLFLCGLLFKNTNTSTSK